MAETHASETDRRHLERSDLPCPHVCSSLLRWVLQPRFMRSRPRCSRADGPILIVSWAMVFRSASEVCLGLEEVGIAAALDLDPRGRLGQLGELRDDGRGSGGDCWCLFAGSLRKTGTSVTLRLGP